MHRTEYGHTRIVLCHFGTFVTVVTFGTLVAFWYTRDKISASKATALRRYTNLIINIIIITLGIIPSEFWYIWFTLAHV